MERDGALEVSLPTDGLETSDATVRKNLVWRVRILAVSEHEIVVEQPVVLRERIHFQDGLPLIGVIAIGPNRWMFETRNLGQTVAQLNPHTRVPAYRLASPATVERCQRRNFYRVSTVGLTLPPVTCHPLTDPSTVVAMEAANRVEIVDLLRQRGESVPASAAVGPEVIARLGPRGIEQLLPDVLPPFPAMLMNLGGGGAGLLVDPEHASALDRSRIVWLRIDLTPDVPAPLGVTARIAHIHIDTTRRTYAGVSFDFSHHAAHEQFVVSQVCRYVAGVQRDQLRRQKSLAG